MIRVVMFDLGQTLVNANNKPFPHVKEALGAVATFTIAGGKPLRSCLVSNFLMPTPPVTPIKIKALFNDYLAILDQAGLRQFFEPVDRRVTLSTHAGVAKPHRKIFEKALHRLKVNVPLSQCLLVTEETSHIQAVRQSLGMQTLRFRSSGSPGFDFKDWAQAPMLIANLVSPHQHANTEAAVKMHLAAAHGVEVVSVAPSSTAKAIKVGAQVWHPISVSGFDNLQNVQVAIPVEGELIRGSKGEVKSVVLGKPTDKHIAEVASYVRSLAKHGQIAGVGQSTLGVTHEIKKDEKGNRKLMRRGFSAA